jgi:ligand-binding SRPBCC domain-containing protein
MTTLTNSIVIEAPCEQVWGILANLAELAEYDPAVATSTVTSATPTGLGASREVTMRDGKHWFKERVTAFEPMQELAFELTACNFPIARLRHTYSFAEDRGQTTVTESMSYSPKFGPLGKLMDLAVIRRSSDKGIKEFMSGLKAHAEKQSEPAETAQR